jgi:biopolymer transport protein ExbB/TolQ
MGGPLFMSILSILFFAMAAWYIYHMILIFNPKQVSAETALRRIGYGKSIGLFALITGILGQLIGLYDAFSAIEKAGDISPAMVYGGLKVSMITTLYGITIYLISIIIWGLASILAERLLEKQHK